MPGNETTAKILGYAGLIPFVVLSVACWLPLPYISDAIGILTAYAAVILSFMGAVHWGAALTSSDQRAGYFIASVIPALLAWVALLLSQALTLAVLMTGFIGLLVYDKIVERRQAFPGWYLPMRTVLTTVVIACLAGSLLSLD